MIVRNWRKVLRHAWSVRLMIVSALLGGAEVTVNVVVAWQIKTPVPPGVFAALAGVVSIAATMARFFAQPAIHAEEE